MRFILCCIISLGLLYAAILRRDGYLVDPARTGGPIVAAAGPGLGGRIAAYCRHDPAACLAAAATLATPLAMAQAARHGGRVPLGARAP